MAEDIQKLAEWIKETKYRSPAIESMKVHCNPVYNILESEEGKLVLLIPNT